MCIGHANPTVGAAVKARVDLGTHFAAPTDGSIVVAEELADRFGLPQWRFTNSGTESTMDAVHLSRGATGRDMILKIEGSYHGHHDAVMVSSTRRSRSWASATTRAPSPTATATRGRSPSSPARSPSTTPTRSRACSASSTARSPG